MLSPGRPSGLLALPSVSRVTSLQDALSSHQATPSPHVQTGAGGVCPRVRGARGAQGAPLPARRPPYLWGFMWAPGDWGNPRLKPRAVQPGPGLSSGSPHSHIPGAGSACAADPCPCVWALALVEAGLLRAEEVTCYWQMDLRSATP